MTPPNLVRFVSIDSPDKPAIGTRVADTTIGLRTAYASYLAGGGEPVGGIVELPDDMRAFITGGDAFLAAASAALAHPDISASTHPNSAVRLLVPVPDPRSIFMFGRIYQGHIDIGNYDQPPHPNFFLKGPNTLIGPDESIVLPPGWKTYTYGTELCLVLGRGGRGATLETAMDWVYGYTICNDITARGELQHKNKMFDTFAPVGPCIIPKANIADPQNMMMRTFVNGALTQEGSTALALWPLPRLIADLTEFVSVQVGDLASTGDVGTVGLVTAGDTIEASIEGIGVLANPTVAGHGELPARRPDRSEVAA